MHKKLLFVKWKWWSTVHFWLGIVDPMCWKFWETYQPLHGIFLPCPLLLMIRALCSLPPWFNPHCLQLMQHNVLDVSFDMPGCWWPSGTHQRLTLCINFTMCREWPCYFRCHLTRLFVFLYCLLFRWILSSPTMWGQWIFMIRVVFCLEHMQSLCFLRCKLPCQLYRHIDSAVWTKNFHPELFWRAGSMGTVSCSPICVCSPMILLCLSHAPRQFDLSSFAFILCICT